MKQEDAVSSLGEISQASPGPSSAQLSCPILLASGVWLLTAVPHKEGSVRVPTWPPGPPGRPKPRGAPHRVSTETGRSMAVTRARAPAACQPARPGPGGPEQPAATCRPKILLKTQKGFPPGLLSLTFRPVFAFFHIVRIKMRLKIQRQCAQQNGQTDPYSEVHTEGASGWQARQRLPSSPCAHQGL